MNKVILSTLVASMAFPLPACAYENVISAKLNELAKDLIAAHMAARPEAKDEKAAVFKFNTPTDLAQKKVGFAVSELLMHHISKNSSFVLVERVELNKVLEELKLSMSGVTSPDDALRAGKIAGVRVLVLGSVEKIGSDYHITARLVDAETSQVTATSYTSIPVRIFEYEAKDYLAYVPEVQAIGLYFLYNCRHNKNLSSTQVTTPPDAYGTTYSKTVDPESFNSALPGFGIRYAPSKKILVDISMMKSAKKHKAGNHRLTYTTSAPATYTAFDESYRIKVWAYRATLNLKYKLSENFSWYLGGGLAAYSIGGASELTYVTPTSSLRMEYFPQKRIGVSISAGYDFISKSAGGIDIYRTVGPIANAKLDKFYLEPSISLYF